MSKPLASVVIPVYNGERFIAAALDSALAQTYRPLEVIVIDDGSTDGTAQIVRARDGVSYRYQQSRGASAARNRGAAQSSGPFLAFLDADDVWLPEKLSTQIDHLAAHPEVDYAICHMRTFLEPGARLSPVMQRRLAGSRPAALPSGLIVRRAAFERVGGFDESLRLSEDCDWFLRARRLGLQMATLPQTLLERRIHGANASSQIETTHRSLLRVLHASLRAGR